MSYHRNSDCISSLFPVKFNGSFLINGITTVALSPLLFRLTILPFRCLLWLLSRTRFVFVILHWCTFTVDYQSKTHWVSTPPKQQKRTLIIYARNSLSFLYKIDFTCCTLCTKRKHHLHDFYHKLQFRGKARDLLEDLSSSAPEKIYGSMNETCKNCQNDSKLRSERIFFPVDVWKEDKILGCEDQWNYDIEKNWVSRIIN